MGKPRTWGHILGLRRWTELFLSGVLRERRGGREYIVFAGSERSTGVPRGAHCGSATGPRNGVNTKVPATPSFSPAGVSKETWAWASKKGVVMTTRGVGHRGLLSSATRRPRRFREGSGGSRVLERAVRIGVATERTPPPVGRDGFDCILFTRGGGNVNSSGRWGRLAP